MSTKPITPQAAQAKVWKAELAALRKASNKIVRDFNSEDKRLLKAVLAAKKERQKFLLRAGRQTDRECFKITRRIGILKGRLGL